MLLREGHGAERMVGPPPDQDRADARAAVVEHQRAAGGAVAGVAIEGELARALLALGQLVVQHAILHRERLGTAPVDVAAGDEAHGLVLVDVAGEAVGLDAGKRMREPGDRPVVRDGDVIRMRRAGDDGRQVDLDLRVVAVDGDLEAAGGRPRHARLVVEDVGSSGDDIVGQGQLARAVRVAALDEAGRLMLVRELDGIEIMFGREHFRQPARVLAEHDDRGDSQCGRSRGVGRGEGLERSGGGDRRSDTQGGETHESYRRSDPKPHAPASCLAPTRSDCADRFGSNQGKETAKALTKLQRLPRATTSVLAAQ